MSDSRFSITESSYMAWNFNHTNVHDSCGGKVACVARDLAIAELFSKIINTRHTFIISEMARRGKEVSYLHTLAIWIIGVLLTGYSENFRVGKITTDESRLLRFGHIFIRYREH